MSIPAEFTPERLETIFHAALASGDTEGVGHALRLLLIVDPRRAIRLHDDLQTAMRVAPFIESTPEPARACPDCEQGKHRNCTGEAWDNTADAFTKCPCQDLAHVELRAP